MLFLLIANLTRGVKDLNNLTKDGHEAKWMSSFVKYKDLWEMFFLGVFEVYATLWPTDRPLC